MASWRSRDQPRSLGWVLDGDFTDALEVSSPEPRTKDGSRVSATATGLRLESHGTSTQPTCPLTRASGLRRLTRPHARNGSPPPPARPR